jgi:hypothetical protein
MDTKIFEEPGANEVYISDGYGNRRVIVFDEDTGKYKRHWGAYGEKPTDDKVQPYDPAALRMRPASRTPVRPRATSARRIA